MSMPEASTSAIEQCSHRPPAAKQVHAGPDVPDSHPGAEADELEKEWIHLRPEDVFAELEQEFGKKRRTKEQATLDRALQEHHYATVDRRKGEIDNVLVFAGLFAGILTAFNIESYELLRPDAADAAAALARISERLDALVVSTMLHNTERVIAQGLLNHAPNASRPPPFVVLVNCLWFTSLILSLTAASMALLVKQWLFQHDVGLSGSSRASTELLQYRIDAYKRWHVHEIAMLVPALLQLALVIFLLGLVILLWNVHSAVAAVSTAFAGTLFLFLFVVTVLPAARWDCCYRSPQALMAYTIVRAFRNLVLTICHLCIKICSYYRDDKAKGINKSILQPLLSLVQRCFGFFSRTTHYRTWEAQEHINVQEQTRELRVETAVAAYKSSLSPKFLDGMRIALAGEKGLPLLRCLQSLEILHPPKAASLTPKDTTLLREDTREALSCVVLYALRQMLTVPRHERTKHKWEATLQEVLNCWEYATPATAESRRSEPTLRTAFLLAMEANSEDNLYALMRILSDAIPATRTEANVPYSTVFHVLSATRCWIEHRSLPSKPAAVAAARAERPANDSVAPGHCISAFPIATGWLGHRSSPSKSAIVSAAQAEPSISVSLPPQLYMSAFHIVVQCMLRILRGETAVPEPRAERLKKMSECAQEALKFLPRFLPSTQALLDSIDLCDQLSFGLHLLLGPLAEFSQILDESSQFTTAKVDCRDEAVEALQAAWNTAKRDLAPPATYSVPLPPPWGKRSARTCQLELLRDEVGALFPPSFLLALGPVV
ncbi:hypothetical protein OH77DRAFT_270524 [Trametes cingulata]|nr:hypothetical protein OH77DRAFT_270524 [Trametes cingulata]